MRASTSDLAAELSRYDALYNTASVSGGGVRKTDDIPNGEYEAEIENVRITAAPALIWRFRIISGSYTGRTLVKFRPISEKSIAWIKEDLTKCGLRLALFSELPRRLGDLTGRRVSVMKKDNTDFGVLLLWPAVDERPVPDEQSAG
jgi:hypothetical protein